MADDTDQHAKRNWIIKKILDLMKDTKIITYTLLQHKCGKTSQKIVYSITNNFIQARFESRFKSVFGHFSVQWASLQRISSWSHSCLQNKEISLYTQLIKKTADKPKTFPML